MKPIRIQRSRKKGWKMPENTVYVGRPTQFGNPYGVGEIFTDKGRAANSDDVIKLYRAMLERSPGFKKIIKEKLRGKNLACWCQVNCEMCHGKGQTLLLKRGQNAFNMTITQISKAVDYAPCGFCEGSGRQPCHADVLLKIANED